MAFYKMMGWCLSEDEKKRTEPISTDEKQYKVGKW